MRNSFLRYIIVLSIFMISSVIFAQTKKIEVTAIEGSAFTNYAYEVLKEAYSRIDMELTITGLPAKRSLIVSNSGVDADGELFRISGIEKTYTNLMPIEIPLILSEWQVYSMNYDFDVKGWHSLKQYTIGVRRGIATTDNGTEGMDTQKVNSNEQLFSMLKYNRVDVVVLSKINAVKVLRNFLDLDVKLLNKPVQVIPVYHYLHKKNRDIIPTLTAAMKQMEDEGIIKQILEKHWSLLTQ
ncbi:MAG: transporter substrate-binding domain-containing protein [Spirochaetaceae bacterium]